MLIWSFNAYFNAYLTDIWLTVCTYNDLLHPSPWSLLLCSQSPWPLWRGLTMTWRASVWRRSGERPWLCGGGGWLSSCLLCWRTPSCEGQLRPHCTHSLSLWTWWGTPPGDHCSNASGESWHLCLIQLGYLRGSGFLQRWRPSPFLGQHPALGQWLFGFMIFLFQKILFKHWENWFRHYGSNQIIL